jgi:hypothetical protein
MSEEAVTFNLELNVEPAIQNMRQVEGLLFRTFGYLQRLGLPENLNKAIRVVQELTMSIRIAHSAIIAFELAAGPIGWWRAALALTGAAFSAVSTGQEIATTIESYGGT